MNCAWHCEIYVKTVTRIHACIILFLVLHNQVTTCHECQKMNKKPLTTATELHPIPVRSPWYHVGMDFVGPITPVSRNGNRFILTLSDYFTKWVEAVPLPSKSSFGVARSLFKVKLSMSCKLIVY